MDSLPIELIQYIFNYLNFDDQIKFKSLSNDYHKGLRIYDLYNIDIKYKQKLDDNILKQYVYLKYLDAKNNEKITNLNHMINLQKLNTSYNVD